MKKRLWKRFFVISCVISMILGTLVGHAENIISTTEIAGNNKVPLLTINVGEEDGELGYIGNEREGYRGPQGFAVQNGTYYILDTQHGRINIYNIDGWRYNIDISPCTKAELLMVKDDKIIVVDNQNSVTGIFSLNGELLMTIQHPEIVRHEYVAELCEIDEASVTWKTFHDNYYCYSWADDTFVLLNNAEMDLLAVLHEKLPAQNAVTDVSTVKSQSVLGVAGGALVLEQFEYVSDVDMVFGELSVRKIDVNGLETFAIIDTSEWKAPALKPFFVSNEGNVYIMENLVDSVKISEVVFDTTGVSRILELNQKANTRRIQMVEELDQSYDLMSIGNLKKRPEALDRAEQMKNFPWRVMDYHKVIKGDAHLHDFVGSAVSGTVLYGIPYCWGGYNGLEDLSSSYDNKSFSSVVYEGIYMAGDVNTSDGEAPKRNGTIGMDCSGLVCASYGLTTKKNTDGLETYGHPVVTDEIKPGDYFVNEWHAMLIASKSGNSYLVYEASNVDGKIVKDTKSLTDLNNEFDGESFKSRSPYCVTCNYQINITADLGHFYSCALCGYVSPRQAHVYDGYGQCVVCGYSQ